MTTTHPQENRIRLIRAACIIAWIVGVILCWRGEAERLAQRPADQPLWIAAVTNLNFDTSLFVPLLLVAPLVWYRTLRQTASEPRHSEPAMPVVAALLVSMIVGAIGFTAATRVAVHQVTGTQTDFGSLPPAYHDEYAYIFQAKTFLEGRTSFPTQGPLGLFDQMHVVNDGTFASRYFPSTGAWMVPFVAMDRPYLGHHLANAIIAALICFAGCRIAGFAAGMIGGLLTALAPGMALFGNLLLAHHPSLAGLSLFLVAFVEARRRYPLAFGLIAGTGLTFAMLGRPMTAAGFALPFGLWLLFAIVRHTEHHIQNRRLATGLGIPILCGFGIMAAYNASVTGDLATTPYSVYTETHTPKHVYGFNNAKRGSTVDAPRRIAKYDDWAENLTPAVAARNVSHRLEASFQWTLGLIPNAMLAILAVVLWPVLRFEARMALASIASLHIVHIPYWFDGIMHYHYVFETGALWCLLAGIVACDLRRMLRLKTFSAPSAWVVACVLATLGTAWLTLPNPLVANANLFARSRIQAEVDGIAFSRLKYTRFHDRVNQLQTPALILIQHDPADIHIEYVNNAPGLQGDALFGHASAFEPGHEDAQWRKDRRIYIFDAAKDTFSEPAR